MKEIPMDSDHPDAAIVAAAKKVAAQPANVVLRRDLGWLLLERSEPVRAEQVFREAWAMAPENRELGHLLSHALARQGRYDEAIMAFETAGFEADEYHHNGHYGYLLAAAGSLEQAEAAFSRALRINADEARLHEALANVLDRQGRIAEALATIETAIQISPDRPGNAGYRDALRARLPEAGGGTRAIPEVPAAQLAAEMPPLSTAAASAAKIEAVVKPELPAPPPRHAPAARKGGWTSFLGW